MVHIHEFVDEGLGHSSYLIDLGDGTAALIDPPRFPTPHEAVAAREDLRIVWTIDTHSHADYVTGSPGLVTHLDATFIAPELSRLRTPHHPLHDGERVDLSPAITLVAIATPGHTPDHHAYLLEENGRPAGLFTGGSLMVGTVGRTDLGGPELAEPLAHEMFRSLRRFDQLPSDLAVYPTHGAGSFCSAPGTSQRTSTLKNERATNPLFSINDEAEFVRLLIGGFGSFPSYFARLPELNRLGPNDYPRPPELAPLSPAEVERHLAEGGVVVDVRPIDAFGTAHIPGSISNTLRPVFASWIGWLVASERQVVFVADADQDRRDLVRQCLDVGHEHLAGELVGGMDAWVASARPTAMIPLTDASQTRGQVVDVRQANEYAAGHLPGAINVELAQVATAKLPSGPLTVMCGHGERAMTGASLLAANGRTGIVVLDGGPDTWATATGTALEVGS